MHIWFNLFMVLPNHHVWFLHSFETLEECQEARAVQEQHDPAGNYFCRFVQVERA